jgi:hypothetical protein
MLRRTDTRALGKDLLARIKRDRITNGAAALSRSTGCSRSSRPRSSCSRCSRTHKTYGSLGAVIALLMWLFVTGLVLLFGAEVDMTTRQNFELKARSRLNAALMSPR